MRLRRSIALAGALGALAAAGCGDDDGDGGAAAGQPGGASLTIYSSLPLQGASRDTSQAIINGMRLALDERDGRAGRFRIEYRSLDDSTAQAGQWEPSTVAANARRAVTDDATVAYLGDFNSAASAVAMPLLNEAGVPQVSPSNTAVGLTADVPGATAGEPEKYYPTGRRHYVRVVPKDTVQASALVRLMQEQGCRRVGNLSNEDLYGLGLSQNLTRFAAESGGDMEVLEASKIDPKAPNYRSVAAALERESVDCVSFSGNTADNAVQLFKDLAAALPETKLFGSDGMAEAAFADPEEGGLPADVAGRVWVTAATLPAEGLPEGDDFFAAYEAEYGETNPNPFAIYGYEAMALILDAIERSGTGERADVIAALFATRDRESVLGTYSIDENGDTTLTDYGIYRVRGGELVFDQTVTAEGA